MKLDNTPLRTLVKTFAGGIIDRNEYLDIRSRLLQKLEREGRITDSDLKRLMDAETSRDDDVPVATSKYTATDWILILLGLGAAIGLGIILYN